MTRVLVVDDEEAIRVGVAALLRKEGYEVEEAEDGPRALAAIARRAPDVLLLDVVLPGPSGLDVCREVRRLHPDLPVIMLSVRDREVDRVVGLEVGADDYLVKPFGSAELVARIRAVLRRAGRGEAVAPEPTRLVLGAVEVDLAGHRVHRGGEEVALSPIEVRLLAHLVGRPGRVVSREEVLRAVWGYGEALPETRTVDYHVSSLRRKVEADAAHPRHIITVHGAGYRYDP